MPRISINTPLVTSTVFIAVAAIAVLAQLPPLLEALVTPRPGADPTQARLSEYLAGHDEDRATYRGRFDGRSLFVKPQPPPRSQWHQGSGLFRLEGSRLGVMKQFELRYTRKKNKLLFHQLIQHSKSVVKTGFCLNSS